jgi:hypothetical protein
MGKKGLGFVAIALCFLCAMKNEPQNQNVENIIADIAIKNKNVITDKKCNAKPFKYLKGRSMIDVLNAKIPPNTRIYNSSEPAKFGDTGKNRLNIEVNRQTIVTRVYCS